MNIHKIGILLVLALAGCASVVRGTTEQVTFDSEPSGAEMRSVIYYECGGPCPVRNEQMGSGAEYMTREEARTPEVPGPACITPCTAMVARNEELIVTFTKAGYEPETVKLTTKPSGGGAAGMAGNVILGGAVGVVVDAGTGAALDHYPNPLKVLLRRAAPAPIASPPKRRSIIHG